MVKLNKDVKGLPLRTEIYLDGYLKENLDTAHELVMKNWDNIGFISGYEGDGKSSLAQTIGLYLDATLNLDKIVFTPQQFFDAVDKADKSTVIIWDEADDLGEQWYKDILQALKSKMKRIRKRNLHIILVTPTIFDLNKYFVIARTRWLIHVYADGTERGFFRFFNREQKKKLYIHGNREWDMDAAKPNFFGRFTKLPEGFPIDQQAYENKKEEATKALGVTGRKSAPALLADYRKEVLLRLYWIHKEYYGKNLPQRLYGEAFGVDQSSISLDLKEVLRAEKSMKP